MHRIVRQQGFKGAQALRQALCVIQPIDTDDRLPSSCGTGKSGPLALSLSASLAKFSAAMPIGKTEALVA
jgi:hypothetical protein